MGQRKQLWVGGKGDARGVMCTWMGNTGLTHNQSWDITRCVRLYYNRKGQGGGLMSPAWEMGWNHVNMTWVTAMTQSYPEFVSNCHKGVTGCNTKYFKWSPRTWHSRMSPSEWNLGMLSVSMTWCLGFGFWVLPSSGHKFRVQGFWGSWGDRMSNEQGYCWHSEHFKQSWNPKSPEISLRQECSLNRSWA